MVRWMVGFSLLAGCAVEAPVDELLEPGSVQSELTKGSLGAAIGQNNFCDDPANLCTLGEGDCDYHTQCAAPYMCTGRALNFGAVSNYNVCAGAHCRNNRRDGDETQVDCGGSCGTTCAPATCPTVNSANRCSTDCLCSAGQGDCDADSECAAGLVCGRGKGTNFGFTGDACIASHCINKRQDGDETGIDCGGACGGVCPTACTQLCFAGGTFAVKATATRGCDEGDGWGWGESTETTTLSLSVEPTGTSYDVSVHPWAILGHNAWLDTRLSVTPSATGFVATGTGYCEGENGWGGGDGEGTIRVEGNCSTNGLRVSFECTSSESCRYGATYAFDKTVRVGDPAACVNCSGALVDTGWDEANCGACGRSCAGTCREGRCESQLLAESNVAGFASGSDGVYVLISAPMSLARIPHGGGGRTLLADGFSFGAGNHDGLVVLDDTFVYWSNGSALHRTPRAGGMTDVLASGLNQVSSLALRGAGLYFTTQGSGVVGVVPVAGGAVTSLATGQAGAVGLAVDDEHAYWLAGSPRVVRRVALEGGSPEALASASEGTDLALTSTHAYWVSSGYIARIAKTGGTEQTVASMGPDIDGLHVATLGADIYWTDSVNALWTAGEPDLKPRILSTSRAAQQLVVEAQRILFGGNGLYQLAPR